MMNIEQGMQNAEVKDESTFVNQHSLFVIRHSIFLYVTTRVARLRVCTSSGARMNTSGMPAARASKAT